MKLNKSIIFIGALVMAGASVNAQEYIRKFTSVSKLSAAVNSEEHEESYPLYSAKDKTLYFVRTFVSDAGTNKKGDQNAFFANGAGKQFSDASSDLGTVNNRFNNAVVGVNGGDNLYVLNQYPANPRQTAKGVSICKKEGDSWGAPQTIVMPPMTIKGDHYAVFVSEDERVMIFSANMSGTAGEEDLYVALLDDEGRWKELASMGAVNSNKSDFAPFLSSDKKYLYFSSFGHGSKGSADIFVSERLDDSFTNWSKPQSLEAINTKGFDAYFSIGKDNTAYFSSNRGKKTMSDIYTTKMSWEKVVPPPVEPEKTEVEKAVEELKAKYDLRLIYFETAKANILTKDATVLNAVADLMKKFTDVDILLSGHTDNQGSDKYNMNLSLKRVEAAKKYLVDKGIKARRVYTQHFGEAEPVADNKTDAGREKNRRVEIKIMNVVLD